jgi:subtilisin
VQEKEGDNKTQLVYEDIKDHKFRRFENRRGEQPDSEIPGHYNGKYVILFKRKDHRQNQRDDKADVFRSVVGLGDYENYVNMTKDYVPNGKKVKNNKVNSTGRNETDTFNPLAPSFTTIKDINRYKVPALIATLNTEQLQKISRHPDVRKVDKVLIHKRHSQETPWGVERVKAPNAWRTNHDRRGANVPFCVADTGIFDGHEDLWSQVSAHGVSVVPDGTDWTVTAKDADTPRSHGTHVSGTVMAMDNGIGVIGVACYGWVHFARIAIKKPDYTTSDEYEMAAIEWAINNQDAVFSISFGIGGKPEYAGYTWFIQAMDDLITTAHFDHNMILCAAAGNDGNKNMDGSDDLSRQNTPSGYTNMIEVSAISNGQTDGENGDQGPADHLTNFSNAGTKTEFAAPGHEVLSTIPYSPGSGKGYRAEDGTSMACPHVAGCFVLANEAYRLDPCEDVYQYSKSTGKAPMIRKMMQATADKLGIWTGWVPGYGYGIVDADACCKKLLKPDGMVFAAAV